MSSKLEKLVAVSKCFVTQPRQSIKLLATLPFMVRGFNYSMRWTPDAEGQALSASPGGEATSVSPGRLRSFFDARQNGKGIWKWLHYFDIYERHFSRFVGREVHILEIGIYSGGSLEMWRDYFGEKVRIYGVDIEEACKCYENEYTKVFIGDQANRNFWKSVRERVPTVDILIDDGGHKTEQQIVTCEEMLPHLRPGGVYLCEDVHHAYSNFSAYMHGLVYNLNAANPVDTSRFPDINASEFQAWIRAAYFYPYVTVLEKSEKPVRQLVSRKHGTEWQPFMG